MHILVPFRHKYDVSEFINKLSHTFLKQVVENCTSQTVVVKLPKFIIEHQLQLDQVLQKMEVGDLFTTKSDLSVLTGKRDVHFTSAIHKSLPLPEQRLKLCDSTATAYSFTLFTTTSPTASFSSGSTTNPPNRTRRHCQKKQRNKA